MSVVSPRSPNGTSSGAAMYVTRELELEGIRFRVTATSTDGGATIRATPLTALPIAAAATANGATPNGADAKSDSTAASAALQLSVASNEVVDVLGERVLELALASVTITRKEDGTPTLVLSPPLGSGGSGVISPRKPADSTSAVSPRTEDVSELRQRLTERDTLSAQQSTIIAGLRSELAEQKRAIVELQADLIDQSEQRAAVTKTLESERLKWADELNACTAQRDELQLRLTNVNLSIQTLTSKQKQIAAHHDADAAAYHSKVEQLTAARDELQRENTKLHKSNEESVEFLGLQMSELKAATTKLETENTHLEEELSNAKSALEAKSNDEKNAVSALASAKQSHSLELGLARDRLTAAQNALSAYDAQRDAHTQMERTKTARQVQDADERVKRLEDELVARTKQRDALHSEANALREQNHKLELESSSARAAEPEPDVTAEVAAVTVIEELKTANEVLTKQRESLHLQVATLSKKADEATQLSVDLQLLQKENDSLLEKITTLESNALTESAARASAGGKSGGAVPSSPPVAAALPPRSGSPSTESTSSGAAGTAVTSGGNPSLNSLFQSNQSVLRRAQEAAAESEAMLDQVRAQKTGLQRSNAELEKIVDEQRIELETERERHALALRERDSRITALLRDISQFELKLQRVTADMRLLHGGNQSAKRTAADRDALYGYVTAIIAELQNQSVALNAAADGVFNADTPTAAATSSGIIARSSGAVPAFGSASFAAAIAAVSLSSPARNSERANSGRSRAGSGAGARPPSPRGAVPTSSVRQSESVQFVPLPAGAAPPLQLSQRDMADLKPLIAGSTSGGASGGDDAVRHFADRVVTTQVDGKQELAVELAATEDGDADADSDAIGSARITDTELDGSEPAYVSDAIVEFGTALKSGVAALAAVHKRFLTEFAQSQTRYMERISGLQSVNAKQSGDATSAVSQLRALEEANAKREREGATAKAEFASELERLQLKARNATADVDARVKIEAELERVRATVTANREEIQRLKDELSSRPESVSGGGGAAGKGAGSGSGLGVSDAEANKLRDELEAALTRIRTEFEPEIAKLTASNDSLKSELSERERRASAAASAAAEEKKSLIEAQKQSAADNESEVQRLTAAVSKLRSDLAAAERARTEKEAAGGVAGAELARARAAHETELAEVKESLTAERDTARSALRGANEQIRVLTAAKAGLETDLERAQSSQSTATREVAQLKQLLSAERAEVKESKAQLATARSDLETARAARNSAASEIAGLNVTIHSQKLQISSQSKDCNQLTADRDAATASADTCRRELRELRTAQSKLKANAAEAETAATNRTREFERAIAVLTDERNSNAEQLKAATAALATIKAAEAKASAELKAVSDELDAVRTHAEAVKQSEASSQQLELERARASIDREREALQADVKRSTEVLQRTTEKHTALTVKLTEANARAEAATQNANEVAAANEVLQTKLSAAERALSHSHDTSKCSGEVNALKRAALEFERQISSLREQIASADAKHVRQLKQVGDANAEVERQNKQLKKQLHEIADGAAGNKKITSLNDRIKQSDAERDALQKHIEELRKDKRTLAASVDALQLAAANSKQQTDSVNKLHAGVMTDVQQLRAKVESLQNELNGERNVHADALHKVKSAHRDDLNRVLTAHSVAIAKESAARGSADASLNAARGRITELEAAAKARDNSARGATIGLQLKFDELNTQLSETQQLLRNEKATTAELTTLVSSLRAQITALQASNSQWLNDLKHTIAGLESTNANNETALRSLQAHNATLSQQRLDAISELTSKTETHTRSVTQLTQTVEDLKVDAAAAYSQLDTLRVQLSEEKRARSQLENDKRRLISSLDRANESEAESASHTALLADSEGRINAVTRERNELRTELESALQRSVDAERAHAQKFNKLLAAKTETDARSTRTAEALKSFEARYAELQQLLTEAASDKQLWTDEHARLNRVLDALKQKESERTHSAATAQTQLTARLHAAEDANRDLQRDKTQLTRAVEQLKTQISAASKETISQSNALQSNAALVNELRAERDELKLANAQLQKQVTRSAAAAANDPDGDGDGDADADAAPAVDSGASPLPARPPSQAHSEPVAEREPAATSAGAEADAAANDDANGDSDSRRSTPIKPLRSASAQPERGVRPIPEPQPELEPVAAADIVPAANGFDASASRSRARTAGARTKSPAGQHTISSLLKTTILPPQPAFGDPNSLDARPPFYPPPVLSHTHGSKLINREAQADGAASSAATGTGALIITSAVPSAAASVVTSANSSRRSSPQRPASSRGHTVAASRANSRVAIAEAVLLRPASAQPYHPLTVSSLDRRSLGVEHFQPMADRETYAAAAAVAAAQAFAADPPTRKPLSAPKYAVTPLHPAVTKPKRISAGSGIGGGVPTRYYHPSPVAPAVHAASAASAPASGAAAASEVNSSSYVASYKSAIDRSRTKS